LDDLAQGLADYIPKAKSGTLPIFVWPVRLHAGHWWLTPVILANWEAEIQRIEVQG
jgi:hypothetical protein